MNSSMRFRINSPQVIYETIDDEVVIIQFESGNYYSLDKAGAEIWHMIESDTPASQITKGITHLYKGTNAEIECAVDRIINELQRENLIVPDSAKEPKSTQEYIIQAETHPETERPTFESPVLKKYTDIQELLILEELQITDPVHKFDDTGWPAVTPDSAQG